MKRQIIHHYKRVYSETNPGHCIYCGAGAESKDHIPPVSLAKNASLFGFTKFILVESCLECNSLLGNRLLFTIKERAEYLLAKYTRKYNIKATWTKEELTELDPELRQKVTGMLYTDMIYYDKVQYIINLIDTNECGLDQDELLNDIELPPAAITVDHIVDAIVENTRRYVTPKKVWKKADFTSDVALIKKYSIKDLKYGSTKYKALVKNFTSKGNAVTITFDEWMTLWMKRDVLWPAATPEHLTADKKYSMFVLDKDKTINTTNLAVLTSRENYDRTHIRKSK